MPVSLLAVSRALRTAACAGFRGVTTSRRCATHRARARVCVRAHLVGGCARACVRRAQGAVVAVRCRAAAAARRIGIATIAPGSASELDVIDAPIPRGTASGERDAQLLDVAQSRQPGEGRAVQRDIDVDQIALGMAIPSRAGRDVVHCLAVPIGARTERGSPIAKAYLEAVARADVVSRSEAGGPDAQSREAGHRRAQARPHRHVRSIGDARGGGQRHENVFCILGMRDAPRAAGVGIAEDLVQTVATRRSDTGGGDTSGVGKRAGCDSAVVRRTVEAIDRGCRCLAGADAGSVVGIGGDTADAHIARACRTVSHVIGRIVWLTRAAADRLRHLPKLWRVRWRIGMLLFRRST